MQYSYFNLLVYKAVVNNPFGLDLQMEKQYKSFNLHQWMLPKLNLELLFDQVSEVCKAAQSSFCIIHALGYKEISKLIISFYF